MARLHKSLMLASAMIGIALLAVFDILPDKIAQLAPLALLALFPSAWLGKGKGCSARSCKMFAEVR